LIRHYSQLIRSEQGRHPRISDLQDRKKRTSCRDPLIVMAHCVTDPRGDREKETEINEWKWSERHKRRSKDH